MLLFFFVCLVMFLQHGTVTVGGEDNQGESAARDVGVGKTSSERLSAAHYLYALEEEPCGKWWFWTEQVAIDGNPSGPHAASL